MKDAVKKYGKGVGHVALVAIIAVAAAYLSSALPLLSKGHSPRTTGMLSAFAIMLFPLVTAWCTYFAAWKGYSRLRFSWVWSKISQHKDLRRSLVENAQWNAICVLLVGLLSAFIFSQQKEWNPWGARDGYYVGFLVSYFMATSLAKKARSDYYLYGVLTDEEREHELSWEDRLIGGKDNPTETTWGRKFAKNSFARMLPHTLGYRTDAMRMSFIPSIVGFILMTVPMGIAYGLAQGSLPTLVFVQTIFIIMYWWSVAFGARIINDRRAVVKVRLSPRR